MSERKISTAWLALGLILLASLSGCFRQPDSLFHPPEWILGTWFYEDVEAGYTFAETTVIQELPNISTDLGELYRLSEIPVEEAITETFYSFTIQTEEGFMTMEFRKVTTSSISLTMRTSVATIGPGMLYRQ